MKLLSVVQEIILHKSIDDLVYDPNLKFPKYKSSLSSKIGLDYWQYIKSPPKNSSQTTLVELQEVTSFAHNRSNTEIELVYRVDKEPLDLFLPLIQKYNIDFSVEYLKNLYSILRPIISDIKYFYNRPRPYQLAEYYGQHINIIRTDTHHTPSYPSGHTAYAALISNILSDKHPEHKVHFEEIVDICGKARMLQGVHFRSDCIAAKTFVDSVYSKLKTIDYQLSGEIS